LRIRIFLLASAAGVLCLCAPAAASAAMTFGTPLDQPSNGSSEINPPSQTVLTLAYPGAQLSSPIDGVVVRFRVQSTTWGNVSLRILHPVGGGALDAVGTSVPAFVGGAFDDLPHELGTRLPIAAGDQIGIDSDDSFRVRAPVTGGQWGYWSPRIDDSDTPSAPGTGSSVTVIPFNADVEADVDHDHFGDETQDACPSDSTTQGACPVQQAVRKKKCKRKKHHQASRAKKCKKHRK
jgi:hypothetical protein